MQRPGEILKIGAMSSSSGSDVSDASDEESLSELDQSSVISEEDATQLSPASDTPSLSDLSSDISTDDEMLPPSAPVSVNDYSSMETNQSEGVDKKFGYIIVGDNLDHSIRPRYFDSKLYCIHNNNYSN